MMLLMLVILTLTAAVSSSSFSSVFVCVSGEELVSPGLASSGVQQQQQQSSTTKMRHLHHRRNLMESSPSSSSSRRTTTGTATSNPSSSSSSGGSIPGVAGYALQFADNYAAIPEFSNFPSTALTFETWVQSTDICSESTVLSYAVDPSKIKSHHKDESEFLLESRAYNNFVIFNLRELIACHDFVWMWKIPDTYVGPPDYWGGCRTFYGEKGGETLSSKVSQNYVDRTGAWHHLAVTWDAASNGTTSVYYDGLLAGYAVTGRTNPIPSGGTLIIGNDQDCLGGCFDESQALYAALDEVRIWNVVRSQPEILASMRDVNSGITPEEDNSDKTSGAFRQGGIAPRYVYKHPNLIAYWKFDEPNDEQSNGAVWGHHSKAHDYSGNGNHLLLGAPPTLSKLERPSRSDKLVGLAKPLGALDFHRRQYAINYDFQGMPEGDITIEFWAKTDAVTSSESPGTKLHKGATVMAPDSERYDEFISFSARSIGDSDVSNDEGYADVAYLDDAIVIEKYYKEFQDPNAWPGLLDNAEGIKSTIGAMSVHINANREGNGKANDHWIDFATDWIDNDWHHVLVSWRRSDGETRLYLDGKEQTAFWKSDFGKVSNANNLAETPDGSTIGAGTSRSSKGSLVLGKQQECHGGCFTSTYSLDGSLANVRFYDGAIRSEEVIQTLAKSITSLEEMHDTLSQKGLGLPPIAAVYEFSEENTHRDADTKEPDTVRDLGEHRNHLALGSTSANYVLSTVPLMRDGRIAPGPRAGAAGYALMLNDQQVALVSEFKGFPSKAITVEFWMSSTDRCREGVPFSYATGPWGGTAGSGAKHENDNSFLIFDYTNFGISVMEDEGHQDSLMIENFGDIFGMRSEAGSDWRSGVGATDGSFHHIAVTWESEAGATNLYIDGRLAWRVQRAKGASIPDGGTLVIGREQDCRGGCFDSARGATGLLDEDTATTDIHGIQDFYGIIEELRVWDRVLTQQELRANIQSDQGLLPDDDDRDRPDRSSRRSSSRRFGTFSNPGVNPKSPGLKAYYKFDEGEGYVARDATGNGNDIILTETPSWIVTDWKSLCGDGILQGAEECDDNNKDDGDGCDHLCRVESGWQCSKTSPSICFQGEGGNEEESPSSSTAPARGVEGESSSSTTAATTEGDSSWSTDATERPPPRESSFRSSFFRGEGEEGGEEGVDSAPKPWYNSEKDRDQIIRAFREAEDGEGGHHHRHNHDHRRGGGILHAIGWTMVVVVSVLLISLLVMRRRTIVPWIRDDFMPWLGRGWSRATDLLPPALARRVGGGMSTSRRLSRNSARYQGLDDDFNMHGMGAEHEESILPLGGGGGGGGGGGRSLPIVSSGGNPSPVQQPLL